jgi:TPR repeat protein
MVFCIKCGTKNDDDIKFCKMCGSRLSNDLNDDGIQKLKKQTLDTIGRAVENDLLVADALDGEPSALKRLITILTQRRDSAGNDNTREMNEIIFAWAERGASKDPSIKTVLSLMYLKGKGTSANVNRGLTLLKEAALGGDADAQFQLGRYYLDGVWFEQSGSEAVRWMTEAAENGHGEALFMLSELYQEGSVVPKDMDRSLDLLIRSADSGYPWAQFKYAKMLKDGKTGTDDRLMIGLFMKACEAGIPEAFYEMAQCYEEGRGVDRSERLFIERMETACGLGVSQA